MMLEKSRKFPYKPHPKQEEFFNSPSKRVLYTGGQPSKAATSRLIQDCINHIKEKLRMTGKVVRMSDSKTFGFIRNEGTDYFFHRDDFKGHWQDLVNDIDHKEVFVEFIPSAGPKGARASEVSRVDHPNQAV